MVALDPGAGLSNAMIQQRFTAVRLFFFDFLIEQGIHDTNPEGRGRYTPAEGFRAKVTWTGAPLQAPSEGPDR